MTSHFKRRFPGATVAALENQAVLGLVLTGEVARGSNMPSSFIRVLDSAGRRPGFRFVDRKVFEHWRSWAPARKVY